MLYGYWYKVQKSPIPICKKRVWETTQKYGFVRVLKQKRKMDSTPSTPIYQKKKSQIEVCGNGFHFKHASNTIILPIWISSFRK